VQRSSRAAWLPGPAVPAARALDAVDHLTRPSQAAGRASRIGIGIACESQDSQDGRWKSCQDREGDDISQAWQPWARRCPEGVRLSRCHTEVARREWNVQASRTLVARQRGGDMAIRRTPTRPRAPGKVGSPTEITASASHRRNAERRRMKAGPVQPGRAVSDIRAGSTIRSDGPTPD